MQPPSGSEILTAAELFFGAKLPGVEIHLGREPESFGAVGFARGSHIYVDERAMASEQRALQIVGHELAHIVQQRQRRVAPSSLVNGVAASDDPVLESEADEAGRSFASGAACKLQIPGPLTNSVPPVLQRLVTADGKTLAGTRDLSGKGARILELIGGGEDWFSWACASPEFRFDFENELKLLEGIVAGIHGSPLLLLPRLGLLAHPARIDELTEDEIGTLLVFEAASDGTTVSNIGAQKALAAHGLLSKKDLDFGRQFLGEVGLEEAPVFQSLSLADRIALYELVSDAPPDLTSQLSTIQKEAAAFSIKYALTPQEFVDYYRYFIATVRETDPQPKFTSRRARFAEATMEALSPQIYGRLSCPLLSEPPRGNDLPDLIRTWRSAGRQLGFARFSSALCHIFKGAELNGATGAAAARPIDDFMERINACLVRQAPDSDRLSQDGAAYYYTYDWQPRRTQLCLAPDGSLTISNFQQEPTPRESEKVEEIPDE